MHQAPIRNIRSLFLSLLLLCLPIAAYAQGKAVGNEPGFTPSPQLQQLARRFFEWRQVQQPASGDDIMRLERPDGWVPDWSPAALDDYRASHLAWLEAIDSLDTAALPVPDRVDARLLRAAIQRVYWELDVLELPHRNPVFYVDQTLGSVFELLVLASPVDEARARNLVLRLEHIPRTLKDARKNLDRPVRPYAEAAIAMLDGIEGRLQRLEVALEPLVAAGQRKALDRAIRRAAKALRGYADWLAGDLETMQAAFAIGPQAYQWFLTNVALLPYRNEELLALGRGAWNRSVAWETLERNRNRDVPELPLFATMDQQIRATALKEEEIRAFLESRDLMTVPEGLPHYRIRPMTAHLEPLAFMGVTDDLASETRLQEDAYRYITEPSADLPYFPLSAARDPRPLVIHEGVPGHYFQLAQSWAHPNPVRRRYFDSSANEGIAFYVEELLLQAGLFDFSPRSRKIIYNYMRLRALRVEVDIRLAVGDFGIEQAADYLARTVPMDRGTALEEAVFFASTPGQAISYQIGKLQVLQFLADARLDLGDDFSLRHFHDFLMRNGNVPIALQRWEYLGRDDEVRRLDALGGRPVTVPR